ncbi:MAG: hypothetical protein ACLP8S_05535 [Solirubrobacteraceae bacterium]
MARRGHGALSLTGGGKPLIPWEPGAVGKFLVEGSGAFHAWRTFDGLAPHHAMAAEQLGISSLVLDGIVNPDGRLEPNGHPPGRRRRRSEPVKLCETLGEGFREQPPGFLVY